MKFCFKIRKWKWDIICWGFGRSGEGVGGGGGGSSRGVEEGKDEEV